MTRLRWLLALPAFLIATTGPSDAADIRDKAGLFSPEAVKKAEADLDRIEKEYSVPIAIETIDSLEGRSIEDVLPEHAKAADVKGLYVLISKKDHKIEVDSYKTYTKYLTRPRRVSIRDTFTHEFKAGSYDAGLAKGLDKIDSTLSEAKAEAGGTLKPTAAPAPRRAGQAQAPVGRNIPGKPSNLGGTMSLFITIGLGLLALFIVIKILGAIFGGGNRGGYAGNQRMMGPGGGGGMGGPGYGPGYGGGGGGGGGGFMSSMFGGIGGALAGNWLYDQFSGRHHDTSMGQSNYDQTSGAAAPGEPAGPDYVGPEDGGADWGGGGGDDGGGGGGDWGGGGGDVGGGGGDWGGGGGGDWGGGGGGDDGGSW
jgi:uncharacterized protein